MSSPLVWFVLVDSATGQPYKGTSASSIVRSSLVVSVVDQFREAVKIKFDQPNYLKDIPSAALLVYRNKAAFDKRNAAVDDGKEEPLEPTESLDSLGSKEEMLVVAVPSPKSSSRSSSDSRLAEKVPHPKRKQRWDQLNEAIKLKQSKHMDSTAYSNTPWSAVESIFNLEKYVQEEKVMDDADLKFLGKYLAYATKCFKGISGKEAKRVHLIAPILICVCNLFDGDVQIVVEEELIGRSVKAHGRFEFMMRRGKKAVCIVEAKKEDIDQGTAQDLVGCEVAAELGDLNIVYGIVTNYIQWNFFRSSNEEVLRDECSITLLPDGPEISSLKRIAQKIYCMLSDDPDGINRDRGNGES